MNTPCIAPYQMSFAKPTEGFTLVEMIVSVGLFAVVMLICVGALLALVGANRKVQALQLVMNNLNITLDGLMRSARMGNTFHCGATGVNATPLAPANCTSGDIVFAFEPYGNGPSDPPWIYSYDPVAKSLFRAQNGGTAVAMTASQVQIDSMQFFVDGTTSGCDVASPCTPKQPKVMIVIKGTAPVLNSKARSTFHLQMTAVQRVLDI